VSTTDGRSVKGVPRTVESISDRNAARKGEKKEEEKPF